jgi:DNA primase
LPKYVNSPETPIFNKRRLLFGMARARRAGHRRLVLMEGYTDVIASHLAGVDQAVATLGTALTPDHARVLARAAPDGVVLLFDGDRAGMAAAERAMEALVTQDLPAEMILMTGRKDPAELIQGDGVEAFQKLLETARPILDVKVELVRQRHDPSLDTGLARAVAECLDLVGRSANPVRREAMLRTLADSFHVSPASLASQLRAQTRGRAPQAAKPPAATRSDGPSPAAAQITLEPAEAEVLAACTLDPECLVTVAGTHLKGEMSRRLLAEIRRLSQERSGDPTRISAGLFDAVGHDPESQAAVAGIVSLTERIRDPQDCARRNLQLLARRQGELDLRVLRTELRQAQDANDEGRVRDLMQQIFQQLRQTRQ